MGPGAPPKKGVTVGVHRQGRLSLSVITAIVRCGRHDLLSSEDLFSCHVDSQETSDSWGTDIHWWQGSTIF